MIYIELTKNSFIDQFKKTGYKDSFSYESLGMIFDFLDESCDDVELDIIAICGDFSEYDSIESFIGDFKDLDCEDCEDDDDRLRAICLFLEKNTTVLSCKDDCILFLSF